MKEIKVRYHCGDGNGGDLETAAPVPKGDWIDLRVPERVKMRAGEFKLISLGVSMQLPEGYEALIIPRSSLFAKHGILQANGVGLIDESYCGDGDIWCFPAYATRDTAILAGERICQFRIIKHQPKVALIACDRLGNADRGGFGSTGC